MKNLLKSVAALAIALHTLSGCGDKKEGNASEILAGNSSKTWHIAKQKDANGDKDKLTSEEKKETLNMYTDGKFSIVDANGTATGTWNVEGTQKLALQFAGQPVTENFSITELNKDKVVLVAADGSEMTLKAD